MLLGSQEFIDRAKVWQPRCGAEVYTLVPNVASRAAMLLDARLARMPTYHAHAKALAAALNALDGVTTLRRVPHTNMMHVFLRWDVEAVLDARDRLAEESGVWLLGSARPADVPQHCRFEWTVGDATCAMDVRELIDLYGRLIADLI